jgi:hypothetical protein
LPRKPRQARSIFSPLSVLAIASLALAGHAARGQSSAPPPAASSQELFPGIPATQAKENFPGIPATPIGSTPLSGPPAVLALEHRPAAQMRAEDTAVVASMTTELSQKARIAGFDIGGDGWEYEQIVCPSFPDYVFLAFSHGAEDNGSSRFVAALERNAPWVRVVSTVSSGTFPLGAPWSRPGFNEIFNSMLRRERGLRPLGSAPAWLSIAMCYAEFTGHRVQVFVPEPLPGSTLDLSRLNANQPQLHIDSDQSADVTFSDASKPSTTTAWLLHFDRRGQILSASRSGERQPATIALKP